MLKQIYNPDVLTCIANLSSDEVFTPPSVVNQMLDTLPKELWSDEKVTFLDPVSKSGVFLREITKRLIDGLESKIPNLEERIEHILRNQVFGIGITELTSLISRRSLYCSKYANGKYSIVQFDDEQGNLKYFETEHTWEKGSCKYCGVKKEIYDRGEGLESYSYPFLHIDNLEKKLNMKFDVIIGNPPYQMSDGGNQASAIPLYHKFVLNSIKMSPRYLTMIIPSRWFSGGKGLDSFRDKMINDKRIRVLHDYINANDCFPNVEIKGGVCYFLWERDSEGKCKVITHHSNEIIDKYERYLKEEGSDIFIRYNKSIPILSKIQSKGEESITKIISSRKPFGLPTSFKSGKKSGEIKVFGFNQQGLIDRNQVLKNTDWIDEYKLFVPYAFGKGDGLVDRIKPILGPPKTCCTETYLVFGPLSSKKRIDNLNTYLNTKFLHFLVTLIKNTQHGTSKVYRYVPIQNFDEEWSDEKLYKKYGLNEEEIEFIESMIRPME